MEARSVGMTLIELVMAIGVAAVLITVAAPGLAELMQRQRVQLVARELHFSLAYARSVAIHESRRVVLCPSEDGETCLRRPDWHAGWIVFVDDDEDREHDPGERLLRVTQAAAPTIRVSAPRSRRRIRYLPDGTSPGSNLTMTVCDTTGVAPPRAVIVSNTGRPREAARGPSARDLVCPR